jgi:hypothetical protein
MSRGTAVQVEGQVSGLSPGVATVMPVRLTNEGPLPAEISDLTVTVDTRAVGRGGTACRPAHLELGAASGHLRVPPAGSTVVEVPVRLSADAPNGCQGAMFDIALHGTRRPAAVLGPLAQLWRSDTTEATRPHTVDAASR